MTHAYGILDAPHEYRNFVDTSPAAPAPAPAPLPPLDASKFLPPPAPTSFVATVHSSAQAAALRARKDASAELPVHLDLDLKVVLDRPTELHIDTVSASRPPAGGPRAARVIVLLEPEIVTRAGAVALRHAAETGPESGDLFDVALVARPIARDDRRLATVARPFAHGGTFLSQHVIDAYRRGVPDSAADAKEDVVSFVCGGKHETLGQRLRTALWDTAIDPSRPDRVKWFASSTSPPGPRPYRPAARAAAVDLSPEPQRKIDALRGCMWAIAVESVSVPGYFTEKLLDCFLTRTVPVYWGCPDIDEYFDLDGIIHVNNPKSGADEAARDAADRIAARVAALDAITDYDALTAAIEANYQAALLYVDLEARLQREISDAFLERDAVRGRGK